MLNKRQQCFVNALLACGDARRAYLQAGYSARGVQSGIKRLTALPEIRAVLEAQQEPMKNGKREKTAQTEQAPVNNTLSAYGQSAADAGAQTVKPPESVSEDVGTAESGSADMPVADAPEILRYLTELLRGENSSERERLRAAELLGKRHGLFSEKTLPAAAAVMIVDDMDG